jgi:NAD(P)-dependent dehydrogenase (short-subunit alcohol dehydrogenase family)
MKYEIPQMLKNGGGSFVNRVRSRLVGVEQLSAYNASKHGVVGLTKTAALEFAQRISG